jgi:hypothetical protein
MKTKSQDYPDKKITRKQALKKAGKYAAFTAAASIILLSPKESQAQSPSGGSEAAPGGRSRGY